jgi:hypothetical protein
VDRFGQALPETWRPTPDYEVAQARDPIVRNFLQSLAPPASVGTRIDMEAIAVKGFEKRWVVASRLSEQPIPKPSPGALRSGEDGLFALSDRQRDGVDGARTGIWLN